MDNMDNDSEEKNSLFDINPTDKENDLLQPIKDENNMDVDIDVANDRQSIDESASPLSNKRSRTQRQADDESGDEVQTILNTYAHAKPEDDQVSADSFAEIIRNA